MNEASSLGLSWIDGLQYVVDRRSRLGGTQDIQNAQMTQGPEPAANAGNDGDGNDEKGKSGDTESSA